MVQEAKHPWNADKSTTNFGVIHKQPNKILLLATPWVRKGEGGEFLLSCFGGWGPNFPIYFSNEDKKKAHFYYG
jgi:hypothetical protein